MFKQTSKAKSLKILAVIFIDLMKLLYTFFKVFEELEYHIHGFNLIFQPRLAEHIEFLVLNSALNNIAMFDTSILDCVNFSHSCLILGVLAYTLQNVLNRIITISDSIKFLDCFFIGIVVGDNLRRNCCNCRGGTFFNVIEER